MVDTPDLPFHYSRPFYSLLSQRLPRRTQVSDRWNPTVRQVYERVRLVARVPRKDSVRHKAHHSGRILFFAVELSRLSSLSLIHSPPTTSPLSRINNSIQSKFNYRPRNKTILTLRSHTTRKFQGSHTGSGEGQNSEQ